ncbi:MAG: FixH family protein [Chitinophagaceae bacterium]
MNWGYKLMLTFIVFIAGMGYLVYRSMGTNFELVEKEYYKSELKYQSVIDGKQNAAALSEPLNVTVESDQLLLQMPSELQGDSLKGRIWFYCAYDASRDRQYQLEIDSKGKQYFKREGFAPGDYSVKVEWKHQNRDYYVIQPLQIP